MVTITGQKCDPGRLGEQTCWQAQTPNDYSDAVQNLSYFPVLPCPKLVYTETRMNCSAEKLTIPMVFFWIFRLLGPNSTVHGALFHSG